MSWLSDSRLIILCLLSLALISLIHESSLLTNIASGLLGFLTKEAVGTETGS